MTAHASSYPCCKGDCVACSLGYHQTCAEELRIKAKMQAKAKETKR